MNGNERKASKGRESKAMQSKAKKILRLNSFLPGWYYASFEVHLVLFQG